MDSKSRTFALLFSLICSVGLAQLPSGSTARLGAFIKLFGDATTFKARIDAQILDKSGKESARVPLMMSAMDENVRLEMDLRQIKSKEMPEAVVNMLKELGMERIVSLILPDKNATYIIYPGAQSCVRMPFSNEKDQQKKTYKVETSPLGKETFEGRSCVKNKVVVKGEGGRTELEATTWTAADLKNFPVQIQTKERENTLVLRFNQVQFAKPETSQFVVPPGYAEYTDSQKMMADLVKKTVSGALRPK